MTSINNNLHIVPNDILCKLNIQNWKYNRPVDKSRIQYIKQYIQETQRVEGIIHLAQKSENEFVIYDGIHRLTALQQLLPQDINVKLFVIVDVMPYDDKLIEERFIGINSAIPVSELYTDEHKAEDHFNIVQYVVRHYQQNYPSFFVNTQHYRSPNMNNTILTNHMHHLLKEYRQDIQKIMGIPTLEKGDLITFIETFHETLRERPKVRKITNSMTRKHIQLSVKQQEKCEKHNMFLFCVRDWYGEIKQYIDFHSSKC